LRLWFGHKPERFAEFRKRYREELLATNLTVPELRKLGKRKRVALLYGARDPQINHAAILQSVLDARSSAPKKGRKKARA